MVDYNYEATIIQNDYGKYLEFVLYDEDNELYDYTGESSIVCYFKKYQENTCKITGVCSTVGMGTVRYQLQAKDTDEVGDYYGELKVYSPSAITTWNNIHLKIKKKVAD